MQPTGISFSYRYESGNLGGCTLTENNTIEYAVDDIPDSSCQYQRNTCNITTLIFSFNKYDDIPSNRDGKYCAGNSLNGFRHYLHTESHTGIFYKAKIKPIRDMNAFIIKHIRFNFNLYDLVKNQNSQYNEKR